MFPTKSNFSGRWVDSNCNICGNEDTDEHLFMCPGYSDLTKDITYSMFFKMNCINDTIIEAAMNLTKIRKRLVRIQEMW